MFVEHPRHEAKSKISTMSGFLIEKTSKVLLLSGLSKPCRLVFFFKSLTDAILFPLLASSPTIAVAVLEHFRSYSKSLRCLTKALLTFVTLSQHSVSICGLARRQTTEGCDIFIVIMNA